MVSIKFPRSRHAGELLVFVLVITTLLGMIVNVAGGQVTSAGVTFQSPGSYNSTNPNPAYNQFADTNKTLQAFDLTRVLNLDSPFTKLLVNHDIVGFLEGMFVPSAQSPIYTAFNQQNKTGPPIVLSDCGAPNPVGALVYLGGSLVSGSVPNIGNTTMSIFTSGGNAWSKLVNGNPNAFVRLCVASSGCAFSSQPGINALCATQAVNSPWVAAGYPVSEYGPDVFSNNTIQNNNCPVFQFTLNPKFCDPLSVYLPPQMNLGLELQNQLCQSAGITCANIFVPIGAQIVALVCSPAPSNPNPVSCGPMSVIQFSNAVGGASLGLTTYTRTDFTCSAAAWKNGGYTSSSDVQLGNSPGMVCQISGTVQISTANLLLDFLPFFTFFLGIVCILMSIGLFIRVGGSTSPGPGFQTGIGVNAQGTRLAQVFGVGFLFWSFISSEFLFAWLVFPLGIGVAMVLLLPTLFFYSLWDRTTSGWTTGS